MMKKLFFLIALFVLSCSSYSQTARDNYARANGNYMPTIQSTILFSKNSVEVGASYTDVIVFGAALQVAQFDNLNDGRSFCVGYATFGGEFERVTITSKIGATKLKKQNQSTSEFSVEWGGSIEYRVIPQLGIVVGSDSVCNNLLLGVSYHFL